MDAAWETKCPEILSLLDECIENPDLFVQPQLEKCDKFKKFAKFLYGLELRLENGDKINSQGLAKLHLEGFDEEGIWQQLQLQNDAATKYFEDSMQLISNSLKAPNNVDFTVCRNTESHVVSVDQNNDDISEDDDDEDDYVFDDDDSTGDESDGFIKPSVNAPKKKMSAAQESSPKEKSSEVDDRFFKLSEMERFLNLEDLKEMRNDDAHSSDGSEDINMFEDILSDDDDYGEDEDDDENNDIGSNKKSQKDIMYEDFFDPPDVNIYSDGENATSTASEKKEYDTRDFNPDSDDEQELKETIDSDDDDGIAINDDSKMQDDVIHQQTPFEKQLEKERKKIKEMEESLLQPKPWQLTGEVVASSRPENSLVHQPTTFACNAKQDHVMTDELTKKIEDIIKNAIINKAWNDVERKVKPKEEVHRYKKPLELDQSKSKKGLAEVYEEEYIKLHDKSEQEKEDPKHVEIKKLMDALLPELHALFSYIPKPPVPEIKVVSNLPAITIEDVAPVAISDAVLLAPEEVKKKPLGAVKGQTEKSKTDKKHERRKKKAFQKLRQKKITEKRKEVAASSSSSALVEKQQKFLALRKLKQSRNTHIVNNESDKIKSSKDFFNRLQDTIQISNSKQKKKKILV